MSQTLIVGFGRSGKDLHLRCLRKLHHAANGAANGASNGAGGRRVGIVEVDAARVRALLPPVEAFRSLADARRRFDPDTVVHICTPPSSHLDVLRDAARHGYSRLLVEKPLVHRSTDLPALHSLVNEYGLTVFVVANWLSSSLTRRLREVLQQRPERRWYRVTISQVKPRFARSLSNVGRETIFDVEIPHQIALSLVFGAGKLDVRTAHCTDMFVNRMRIPYMGTATITLADEHGRAIVVYSDLTSPVRERSIELLFDDGTRTVGYYPSTEADSFSQLLTYEDDRPLPVQREILVDDPLSAFIGQVYDYFDGRGPRPDSDVDFNTAVVSTISQAKAACGLPGENLLTATGAA